MPVTEREHLEVELTELRRRLADVTNMARQVPATEAGRAYRHQLETDIRVLEERLASEKG